jgi:HK97 family phage prohead protease
MLAAMSDQTRKIGPLSVRAGFAPDTVDESARTVDVVWTTGAAVLRNTWDGAFYEELSLDPKHVRMDRLNNGAPFLPNHDASRVEDVLGVVESARIEGGKGIARVRFSKAEDDPKADAIFRKIKDGIIQNVSVGYRVHKFEKVAGDEKVPTYRAVDWQPFEISAVPMGADDGAGFRSEENLNTCILIDDSQRGMAPQEKQQMADEKKDVAPAQVVDVEAVRANAQREERERASGINSAVRAAKLGDAVAQKLINDGVSLDAARAFVLSELEKRDSAMPVESHVRAEVVDDSMDKFFRGAEAALLSRSGQMDKIQTAVKRGSMKAIETDPGEFRGYSLVDLAKEALERRGINVRGMRKIELVAKAFTFRASGMATTSDFAILLENVTNKALQAGYEFAPDSWSRFCRKGSVNDFRANNRYRVGSFGTLDALNEHGEFKNKSIPDGEKASISIGTKGNVIGISRQAIINDDMGAFVGLAAAFGQAAKNSIESDVFALLANNSGAGPTQSDTNPFFYSGRGNTQARRRSQRGGHRLGSRPHGSHQGSFEQQVPEPAPQHLAGPAGARWLGSRNQRCPV